MGPTHCRELQVHALSNCNFICKRFYLLQGGLHLLRGELLFVHPLVVPTVQPDKLQLIKRDPIPTPPIKGLVVFKVLAQSLQEESEFAELYEVWAVFVWSFGDIFNVVETHVDCRDGIEERTDSKYITNSLK